MSPKEELLSKSLDYEEKDNNRLTGIRRKTCQRSSKDNKKTISGTQDVLDSAIMWITFLASTIPGPRKKKGKSRPG